MARRLRIALPVICLFAACAHAADRPGVPEPLAALLSWHGRGGGFYHTRLSK